MSEKKLIERSLIEYSELIDSPSPAPGGGSVSAYAGALAASLGRMLGHLTITKKAYATLAPEDRRELEASFGQLEAIRRSLLGLVDEDAEAYTAVMAAYRLPKDSEEAVRIRDQAIAAALVKAARVPEAVAASCLTGLALLEPLIVNGSRSVVSDGLAAVHLFGAAVRIAIQNISENARLMKDEAAQGAYATEILTLTNRCEILSTRLLELGARRS